MIRDPRESNGVWAVIAFIMMMFCGVGHLLLSFYDAWVEAQSAHVQRQAAEEAAHKQRAWNERLYHATTEAVLHPTSSAFAELAQEFPSGTHDFGYRMVELYATLDNPSARQADWLQAWQKYSQTTDNDTWNIQEVLRTTHPRMEDWIRALRLNLRDPRLPRGVQDALLDMYTLGGPRPERMVEQHL